MNVIEFICLLILVFALAACGGSGGGKSGGSPPTPVTIESTTITVRGQVAWPDAAAVLRVTVDGVEANITSGEWSHEFEVPVGSSAQDATVAFYADGVLISEKTISVSP